MNKYVKITFLGILFSLFLIIRAYGKVVFYDPLAVYFKNDYLHTSLPKIDTWHLLMHMLYRYILNSLVSLGIIWVVFQKKEYLKFSIVFFTIAFIILIAAFVFLLRNNFADGYLLPFYVRRFIIHPLFLLLLLPAFYYQKLSKE